MLIEERSLILWTLPVKQQQRRVQMRTEIKVMFLMRRISVASVVMKDSLNCISLCSSFQLQQNRLDIGSDTRPTLTVLPPSTEELDQEGRSSCSQQGFPSDWSLAWRWNDSRSNIARRPRAPGGGKGPGLWLGST
ncbi:immunoglobulin lambda-like polypeptide 5 [Lates japonicus]|nr:immunoglobulin lambda-like polypeptide 5 [Lates japonicus]